MPNSVTRRQGRGGSAVQSDHPMHEGTPQGHPGRASRTSARERGQSRALGRTIGQRVEADPRLERGGVRSVPTDRPAPWPQK